MSLLTRMSYKKQKQLVIALFLFVPLTLLLTFSFLPVLTMIGYSFTSWNGYSKTVPFVGLDNYITLFTKPEYFSVFGVSLYYFVGSFVQMGLALWFAVILSQSLRFRNFFKGTLFFPYLLNGVAVGFIFLFFFKPDGTLDTVLRALGLGDAVQYWLKDPNIINVSLTGASIWRYIGFNFILFLGVISSISSDIYEAADLDGANKWQQFRYIIWPSILQVIQLNLILAVSGSISVFETPYVMTGGSNGSNTFVIQTVDVAFKYNKLGLASAMAVVLMVIVLIVTRVQQLWLKKRT
jgi:raffinose/stachyose/melibiose transport system permease protein